MAVAVAAAAQVQGKSVEIETRIVFNSEQAIKNIFQFVRRKIGIL